MNRSGRPQIRLTNLDQTTRTCEFELTNASTAFANALRRVMIAEVPTFAFEHIEFQQNTSPLPDEFIAHRLGLIPLYSEKAPEFKFQSECDCEDGCPKCTVLYIINVACDTEKPRIVTTDDLEYYVPNDVDTAYRPYIEAAQTIKPVEIPAIPGDENVPITICKLGKGQILQVLCKATKGIAREHAKWSPCSCAAYRMDPIIKVDQAFFVEKAKDDIKYLDTFVSMCPNNVFKKVDSEEEPIAVDTTDCTFCRQCQEFLESEGEKDSEGLIVIDQVPDKYIFKIESTGALRPEVIVSRAFDILKKKLFDLLAHIKECPLA